MRIWLQGATPANGSSQIITWSLILVGILIVGLVIIMRLKKKLTQTDELTAGVGFTLSDLRELHKNGKMSDEEFEKAKAQIVAMARAAGARRAAGAKQDL